MASVRDILDQTPGKSVLDPVPEDKWQILYWPARNGDGEIMAGAGRAEYLRVIFEEAGVEYEHVTKDLVKYFWEDVSMQPYPVLAPPTIRKGSFVLSQCPIAAKYLAVEFGLFPEERIDGAHAEMIVTTVHEYIAEGRMAFHPVKNNMSYSLQKEEAKPFIEAFKTERLPRYMTSFERFLLANRERGEFFIGASLTYVDLQVMVMLQVTRHQWPDAWELIKTANPALLAFLEMMEARPKIQAYLSSDRRNPHAGDSLM